MSEFSKRLVQAREKAGLTQQELAKRMKVSKSTISMWENGNRKPSVEILTPLARALHVVPDYFTKLSDDNPGYLYIPWSEEDDKVVAEIVRKSLGLEEKDRERLLSYAEFLLSQGEK